jgi:hypothetical protein
MRHEDGHFHDLKKRGRSFNGPTSGSSTAAGSYSLAQGETELPHCVIYRSTSSQCSEQAPKLAYTKCQQSVTVRPLLSAFGKDQNSFE